MMKTLLALSALSALSAFTGGASAQLIGQEFTTLAPPATLGGFPMTKAGIDSRTFTDVVSASIGGDCTTSFTSPVSVRQIGSGWATWSHGYTGSVYYSNGSTNVGGFL